MSAAPGIWIRVPPPFLDRHLVIRNFTPAAVGIFNLIPGDRGRPLTDLATELDQTDLRSTLQAVLESRQPREVRVSARQGSTHYMMRLLPYREADGNVDGVLMTFIDVSKAVESEARLQVMVDELNHRVRNTLQLVMAIAGHTLRQAISPPHFVDSFGGRLRALGRAHELVSRGGWGDVPLLALLTKELEPFGTAGGRVALIGPLVLLTPKEALALGMVVHEMATNAAKHGALASAQGRVTVEWSILPAAATERGEKRGLVVHWREEGGPPVQPPARRGFGSELIQRQLRHDLRGSVELDYAPEGLRATISVPLEPRPLGREG